MPLLPFFIFFMLSREALSGFVYLSLIGKEIMNFVTHPCSFLAICSRESREASGTL